MHPKANVYNLFICMNHHSKEYVHILQVAAFLDQKHGEKYYIINTSERATYDGDRYFGSRVTNYHWPDHHGPPFTFLYQIALEGYNWLKGKSMSLV